MPITTRAAKGYALTHAEMDANLAAVQALVSGDGTRLARWNAKLRADAANAKIVLIGDSTTDYTTSSSAVTDHLKNYATLIGEPLAGMSAANITAQGANGITLAAWLADSTKLTALAAAAPDLVVASFLLNDVRIGLCDLATAISRLAALVTAINGVLPNADMLLRIPNPMLTTNVSSLNYVQTSGGTINPAGLAQTYSDLIRSAYLQMRGRYVYVDVIDIPSEVFGTVCRATHPLMADQLHPTPRSSTTNGVPVGGGYVEIGRALARRIGASNAAYVLNTSQYATVKTGYFGFSAGSGYIDIYSRDVGAETAAQFPLSTSDVLLIPGFSAPISLSSATIYRPWAGVAIRVSLSGDWTAVIGQPITIASSHVGNTTGDRQIVSVDLPSIAAGATASVTAAVTGVRTGALHDATAVSCTPPASFVSAGLLLLGCYPSANDTVTLVVLNPTGGAVDLAAANFAFWVIR